ncbi:MAG: hypothetical protein ACYDAQ_07425 [Mycobacteriales bacterium]
MTDLELKLTGHLGEVDFSGALATLQRGYELLLAVQREVLGPRAEHVRWVLTGLRDGSAVTLLRGLPLEADVSEADLGAVVDAYAGGTEALAGGAAEPPRYFDTSALQSYKALVSDLKRYQVGDLVATVPGRGPVTVPATVEMPVPVRRLEERYTVQGSVIGRIEAINMHDRREVALWSELDSARVKVSFAERLYTTVHAALRHRVEASGELVEDAFGRPVSLTLDYLEMLPEGRDAPALASLVGSLPDLTAGEEPRAWLEQHRQAMGLE